MKLLQMLDAIELRKIDAEMADYDAMTNTLISLTITVCTIISFINLILIGYNSIQFTSFMHRVFAFPDVPTVVSCVCGYFVYDGISSYKAFRFENKTLSDIFLKTATTFCCMGILTIAFAML